MITRQSIEHYLKQELRDYIDIDTKHLAQELYNRVSNETAGKIEVPKEVLEEAYAAVRRLKDTIEGTVPTETQDIIDINELGVLEYHLSELLNKY